MKGIKERTPPELCYYSDYPAVGFRNDKLLTKSYRNSEPEISEGIQGLKDKK